MDGTMYDGRCLESSLLRLAHIDEMSCITSSSIDAVASDAVPLVRPPEDPFEHMNAARTAEEP